MVGYLYVRYPIFRPKSLTMKMDLLFGSDQKKIPSPMSPERGACYRLTNARHTVDGRNPAPPWMVETL